MLLKVGRWEMSVGRFIRPAGSPKVDGWRTDDGYEAHLGRLWVVISKARPTAGGILRQ